MIHNLAETLRHAAVWLLRVRHRRGYGVHSPFAYNMIRRVFFETQPFYAYAPLQHTVGSRRNRWQTRADRLMLRLANEVQPQRLMVCGELEVPARYAAAGCRRAVRTDLPPAPGQWPARPMAGDGADMWLCSAHAVNLEQFEAVAARTSEQSVWVMWHIYASPRNRRLWRAIERHERAVLTFDLYDVGIVFFNRHYSKQSYKVSF